MEYTLDQHIGVFPNAFPQEWCDFTIQLMEDHLYLSRTRSNYQSTPILQAQDTAINLNDIISQGNPKSIQLQKEIGECLNKFHEIYRDKYGTLIWRFKTYPFKIQKTSPTEGYHSWHYENINEIEVDKYDEETIHSFLTRFAAFNIYLNDIKEGGETEFLFQSKRIPAKKGTLCIFPSSYTHLHRGNPPLSENKYIITGWLNIIKNNE